MNGVDDPRFTAGMSLLRRTGAAEIQVRWSDDEEPIVWFAVARYRLDENRRPRSTGDINGWETAAGHDPLEAVLRLCQEAVDGGTCRHCGRPSMFHAELDEVPTILDPMFCMYEWDPEMKVFRRGCEGADR